MLKMPAPTLKTLLALSLMFLAAGSARAAATALEPAPGSGCGTPQLAMTPLLASAPSLLPSPAEQTPLFVDTQACCTANCFDGPDVSCCTGGTCSAKDDPNGYVVCGGVYTYCVPYSVCDEGAKQWVDRGCCCEFSVPRQRSVEQECIGGQWRDTGRFGCAGGCSSGCLEW